MKAIKQKTTLSVIIPVFNEMNTILEVLKQVQKVPYDKEIIVVDDGSTDGTREILKSVSESNIRVILNDVNRGKGFAVKTGIRYTSHPVTIIQDADLEYYPDEYQFLISKIVEGKADVVFGNRFMGEHRVFYYYHYLGNAVLNRLANFVLNTNMTDIMTGLKAFKTEKLKLFRLQANGFGIETELAAESFKHRLRVYEVPVSYNGRTYEEGKKLKWYHFFHCVYWLLRGHFRSLDIGRDTLYKLTVMRNNNRWTSRMISPFLGAKILELGSGIGTFSKFLIRPGRETVLSDINPNYIEYLKNRFTGNPFVRVVETDACRIDRVFKNGTFDTVLGINFLEHVQDDRGLLEKIHHILEPDGRVVLLVPAHQMLYGRFDAALEHYRRYTKTGLVRMLEETGFQISHIRYMNFLSALGWFVEFKVLRKKKMPASTIRWGDKMIPLIACVERFIRFPFGLSLLCVAEKRANES